MPGRERAYPRPGRRPHRVGENEGPAGRPGLRAGDFNGAAAKFCGDRPGGRGGGQVRLRAGGPGRVLHADRQPGAGLYLQGRGAAGPADEPGARDQRRPALEGDHAGGTDGYAYRKCGRALRGGDRPGGDGAVETRRGDRHHHEALPGDWGRPGFPAGKGPEGGGEEIQPADLPGSANRREQRVRGAVRISGKAAGSAGPGRPGSHFDLPLGGGPAGEEVF